MKKRLITGSVILLAVALFLFTANYTPYAFDVFIGLLSVMACVEVTRVLERKKLYTNIIFVGSFPAILYIAMTIGILNKRDWYIFFAYFLVIIVVLFIINFLYTIIFQKITFKEKTKYDIVDVSNVKYGLTKCMNSTFVMIYPTLLFASFFVMTHFFDFSFVDSTGIENTTMLIVFFLVLTFVITMVTDSMALVVGRIFKGPKLCPLISPNKTISGAIGGLTFGTIGGILTYYFYSLNSIFSSMVSFLDITLWKIAIISFVVSFVGQVGDLVASALKRSARVKDYGTIFPGHGGVMDRVDGLIFNGLTVLISMFILI